MAEDVGPDEIGGLFKDPEFFIGVVKGRDGFFEGWSDLVGEAFEVDGVGGADLSGGSQGEVEIEQGGGWTGAQGGVGPYG